MEKFNRWAAKHAWAAIAIGCVCCFAALSGLAIAQVFPKALITPCLVLFAVIWGVWVLTRANALLRPSLQKLNTRLDPYPMLEETKTQLDYPGYKHFVVARQMNYALALHFTGQHDSAYEQLASIPIESLPRAQALLKATYYNNLMAVCLAQDYFAEAETAYENMLRHFGGIKSNTQKASMTYTVETKRAQLHFCRREYEQAIALVDKEPINPLLQVGNAFFRARIYLAMGDVENAETELEYVVQHGNRLYYVTEAQALLDKINTEEQ